MVAVFFVPHELHEDGGGYFGLCTFKPELFAGGADTALLVDINAKIIDGEAAFIAIIS